MAGAVLSTGLVDLGFRVEGFVGWGVGSRC